MFAKQLNPFSIASFYFQLEKLIQFFSECVCVCVLRFFCESWKSGKIAKFKKKTLFTLAIMVQVKKNCNDECHITVILLKVLILKWKHCHDTMLLYGLNGKQQTYNTESTKKEELRSIKRKSLR